MCTNFQVKQTTLTFLDQICPKMDLWSEIQKTNVGIKMSIVKMSCMPIFRKKQITLTFSVQIYPKMNLESESQKSKSGFGIGTMCTNFQLKQTTLNFLAQICPKRKLGFEIQKTNVEIRISMLEIPCVPIFKQNGRLFGPKFAPGMGFEVKISKI